VCREGTSTAFSQGGNEEGCNFLKKEFKTEITGNE
jgi:hypothetical protein